LERKEWEKVRFFVRRAPWPLGSSAQWQCGKEADAGFHSARGIFQHRFNMSGDFGKWLQWLIKFHCASFSPAYVDRDALLSLQCCFFYLYHGKG